LTVIPAARASARVNGLPTSRLYFCCGTLMVRSLDGEASAA
jgi:hypothetical protein